MLMRWLLAAGAAVLTACAVPDVVSNAVLPPEQAAALGSRMSRQIEAKQGLASPAMQQRISAVGHEVVAAAGDVPQAYDFSFKVLEAPDTVNAFALPGGKIYATSGLMRMADTEGQLAAVLAHEVAHVTQRHIADRLATSYGVQTLAAAALGADPGAATQLASSVLQQGFLLKYSREQELEADAVGVRTMARAGYDPEAAIAMFRKLQQGEDGGGPPQFLSTHPSTGDRIAHLKDVIASANLE